MIASTTRPDGAARPGDAVREAADMLAGFGEETYARDVFVPPTSEQYAEINALLKRERGHQLEAIAADCMRRAYATAARLLRESAADLDEQSRDRGPTGADDGVTLTEFLLARIAEDEARFAGISSGSGDPDFYWGPDRIGAECEAKRGLVDRANVAEDVDTLLILAAVYADHPYYREGWKP